MMKLHKILRWFAYSLLASTLLFSRQIGMWSSDLNRFNVHWSFSDGAAVALAILASGLAGTLLAVMVMNRGGERGRKALGFGYLLVIGSAVISWLPISTR